LIDSHCHLDDPRFSSDLEAVLLRANQSDIQHLVIPGVQHQQWSIQLLLAENHQNISNAFGIHPWYCEQHNDADLQQLETLLPHAVAVGECGLDFTADKPAEDIQQYFFQKQLELAQKFDLPLIIHSVKSADSVAIQLRSYPQLRGVIHGFSGSIQQANNFIHLGFYIGIGTRLLQQRGQKNNTLLREIPLELTLLESDAPDGLGKHQRNEPANLIDVAQALAHAKNIPLEFVQKQCTSNTKELFSL